MGFTPSVWPRKEEVEVIYRNWQEDVSLLLRAMPYV